MDQTTLKNGAEQWIRWIWIRMGNPTLRGGGCFHFGNSGYYIINRGLRKRNPRIDNTIGNPQKVKESANRHYY